MILLKSTILKVLPCLPYDGTSARFEIRVQCHAHTRFHSVRLTRHGPPPLRSSLRLLNVRQVIYTRGFTARKILRKALTSIETGVVRRDFVPRWDARLLRTKNHFLRPATWTTNYKHHDWQCRTVGAMRLLERDSNMLSALRTTITKTVRGKKYTNITRDVIVSI